MRLNEPSPPVEDESARLLSLLLLLLLRRARAEQQGPQAVAINGLCSDCVTVDDVEQLCGRGWCEVHKQSGVPAAHLTEEGEAACKAALNAIPAAINGTAPPRPHWIAAERKLVFKGQVLKRFRKSAPNQECILNRFEQLGWPDRIDDPLSDAAEITAGPRRRETIKQINKTLIAPLFHFLADGTGIGILWINTSLRDNV